MVTTVPILSFLLISIMCIFIAVKALQKYISVPTNYEYSLYWGFSFLVLGIHSALYFSSEMLNWPAQNMILFTETYAWWLQLYAVSIVAFENIIHYRKKIRSAVLILLLVIFLLYFPLNNILYFNFIHFLILSVIAYLFYKIKDEYSIYQAYVLLAASEFVEVINVFTASHYALFCLKTILLFAGISIIFLEVKSIISLKN